jgi:obg-like ATPase 1
MLKDKKFVKDYDWNSKEVEVLNNHLFLTSKPVVYLVNIGDAQYVKKQNSWLPKVQEYIKSTVPGPMIPYSADFESKVVDAGKDDKEAQAKRAEELGSTSMIDRIIKAGYKNLQLINFFTAGEDEVRSWTIRQGTLAPGAGGVIHTDFTKFFICAEVMRYEDLVEKGSEKEVKAAGLYRQQGKDYLVNDGDIMYFKIGANQSVKK